MSYENAAGTELLATNCAICNRPLLDSESVTRGIGPVCREKAQIPDTLTAEQREKANAIIHQIAVQQTEQAFIMGTQFLRALGCDVLADLIWRRSTAFKQLKKAETAEPTVFIREHGDIFYVTTPYRPDSLAAWRRIPGRQWHGVTKKNEVPTSQRQALWALLQSFYAGHVVQGPKGRFVIPGEAPSDAARDFSGDEDYSSHSLWFSEDDYNVVHWDVGDK